MATGRFGIKKLWLLIAGFLFLAGCATTQFGSTRFPEPSVGFQPKLTYNTTYDKMWGSVMDVLDIYKIPVASSDRNEGRIITEYIQGQSQAYAMGLLGAITTRYRYFITINKKGPSTQKLKIVAKMESSSGLEGQWRDISNDNREGITNLENWLYEQIEKFL